MELSAAAVVNAPRRTRLIGDAALLGLAAVWGATFYMVKDATLVFPVLAFLAVRFAIAAVALVPFVLRIGRWPKRREWVWGLAAGVSLCLTYVFETFAMRLIDSGRTGFLAGLYVIMVPILAFVLLRHKLLPRVIVGTLLAFGGLTLLSYAPGGNLLGDILGLLCALCFAFQILAVEKFPKGADWRLMALIQSATVAVLCGALLPILAAIRNCDGTICTALMPFAESLPTSLPIKVLAVAAFTGLVATAMGLAIQAWAQRILPPSDTALIFAMESPFAVFFGFVFGGELVSGNGLLGCGLILAGMLTTALNGDTKPG